MSDSTLAEPNGAANRGRVPPDVPSLAAAVLADLDDLRAELAELGPAAARRAWWDIERRIGGDLDLLATALRAVLAEGAAPDPAWLISVLAGLALYYDCACRGLAHWIPDVERCVAMHETLARRQAHALALADLLAS